MDITGINFMGAAVGILALICALVLLFGRSGTRKILGWGAVAVIAAVALFYAGVAFYAWTAKPFEDLIPPTPIAVGILALICTLVLLFRGARRVLGLGAVAVALFYAGVAAQRHYGAWTATAPKLLSDAEVGLAPNNTAVTAPPFDPSKPYEVIRPSSGAPPAADPWAAFPDARAPQAAQAPRPQRPDPTLFDPNPTPLGKWGRQ
jgi:hypothetical protein